MRRDYAVFEGLADTPRSLILMRWCRLLPSKQLAPFGMTHVYTAIAVAWLDGIAALLILQRIKDSPRRYLEISRNESYNRSHSFLALPRLHNQ